LRGKRRSDGKYDCCWGAKRSKEKLVNFGKGPPKELPQSVLQHRRKHDQDIEVGSRGEKKNAGGQGGVFWEGHPPTIKKRMGKEGKRWGGEEQNSKKLKVTLSYSRSAVYKKRFGQREKTEAELGVAGERSQSLNDKKSFAKKGAKNNPIRAKKKNRSVGRKKNETTKKVGLSPKRGKGLEFLGRKTPRHAGECGGGERVTNLKGERSN